MSFPGLVLVIAIVAVLGPNMRNAMIAITVGIVPGFTRLVRGQSLTVREETFIEASHAIGTSRTARGVASRVAEHPRAAQRPGLDRVRFRAPRGGRAQLPRPRRAAADGELGCHAPPLVRVHPRPPVGRDPGRRRHRHHRLLLQRRRRRAPGRARRREDPRRRPPRPHLGRAGDGPRADRAGGGVLGRPVGGRRPVPGVRGARRAGPAWWTTCRSRSHRARRSASSARAGRGRPSRRSRSCGCSCRPRP